MRRRRSWKAFSASIVGDDPETADALQEAAGWALADGNPQEKMVVIQGPPRSGKTTLAWLLENLVGIANTARPSLGSSAPGSGRRS